MFSALLYFEMSFPLQNGMNVFLNFLLILLYFHILYLSFIHLDYLTWYIEYI